MNIKTYIYTYIKLKMNIHWRPEYTHYEVFVLIIKCITYIGRPNKHIIMRIHSYITKVYMSACVCVLPNV